MTLNFCLSVCFACPAQVHGGTTKTHGRSITDFQHLMLYSLLQNLLSSKYTTNRSSGICTWRN